jgi:glycerol-3-phosphate dehydrogenase subunit B
MPSADVAVIGAGLAGLATAIGLARRGASVAVVAAGNGATHAAGGPIDVAALSGKATPAAGIEALATKPGHPYALLAADVAPAVEEFRTLTAAAGLSHVGSIEDELRGLPTGIGGVRPVAIVPAGQAAALAPWHPGETLVLVGPAGFKDFWPRGLAASLGRPSVWAGVSLPERVVGLSVDLPSVTGRRNLSALTLAGLFDDPDARATALDAIGRAVDAAVRGPARVALPAVLGRSDHATALREAADRLARPVMELPLVSPGIPGLRLYETLRSTLRELGGRMYLGHPTARVEVRSRRIQAVAASAAARQLVIRVDGLVLATGGITGGGIVGTPDGSLRETVLGLPVEGPPIDDWIAGDPLDPGGLPIAVAGLRTDAELRPIDPARPDDGPLLENVRVVGGNLAGQRYLTQRCGDGVAIASARRAAASLAGETSVAGPASLAGPAPLAAARP